MSIDYRTHQANVNKLQKEFSIASLKFAQDLYKEAIALLMENLTAHDTLNPDKKYSMEEFIVLLRQIRIERLFESVSEGVQSLPSQIENLKDSLSYRDMEIHSKREERKELKDKLKQFPQ